MDKNHISAKVPPPNTERRVTDGPEPGSWFHHPSLRRRWAMRRILFALVGGLAVLAAVGRGFAIPLDTDPSRDYPVTPEVGPWMISVTYFEGEQAKQLAHEMVLELRKQGYPAYVF